MITRIEDLNPFQKTVVLVESGIAHLIDLGLMTGVPNITPKGEAIAAQLREHGHKPNPAEVLQYLVEGLNIPLIDALAMRTLIFDCCVNRWVTEEDITNEEQNG